MSAEPVAAVRRPENVAGTLEEELLRLLGAGSKWVPAPVFVGAVLIFAIAYDTAPRAWLIAWLIGVLSILVLRYFVLTRLPLRTDLPSRVRLRIAVLLSGLNGCAHGSAVAFFPYLVEFERFVVFMVMLAFCAGAVSSTAGYRPVFMAYVVPGLVPLAAVWMLNVGGVVEWHHVYVGLLTLLYGAVLTRLAYQAFQLFRESFEIRLEHVALNTRLTKALDDSRVANAAKTRFLAVASHDLRQPVHALALFSSSLSRRNLDERTREIASHVETAIDTLSTQLDALLDVSRLDAGIVRPSPASFALDRLLARLEEQFTPLADEKGLALTVVCPPNTVVTTDETLLEQIVRNLIGNAIKYTDAGSISMVVTRDGERAFLAVTDTGRGIPLEAQPHVFEEFYQVDNPGRDRSRGLGLGLAIARRLAELLDLPLTMSSAVGVGTTFTIGLQAAPSSAPRPRSVPRVVRLASIHVLVVDDEPEIREGMRLLLEDLGCRVELAANAAEAVRLAERARPDVVLCDFRLRNDDGLHAIRQLRALHPGLPAALVTGDSSPDRLREAHAAGVGLLHKPVRPDTLVAAINDLCGASAEQRLAEKSQEGQQSGS
jgi:signal transduction histidine kinase/ActR/RegA family two-component response regulator